MKGTAHRMEFEKGSIVKGKVSGIAKFGAFVELAPGKSGLVYISEISNTFVREVSEHLTVGQEVTVKVLNIDDAGRINLSIKQAAEPAAAPPVRTRAPAPVQSEAPDEDAAFEDKLKRFMKASDSKMSDIRRQADKRGSKRRGGR